MQKIDQHNEQGFAFILELVVVAMVLSAVGFGLFQYSQHSKQVASVQTPASAVTTANEVNSSLEKSANIEVKESVGADALADELDDTDDASSDLEGGISESSF